MSVQPMMSVVTTRSSLSSPDWGGEMPGQLTPIKDQVVKIVLVGWCGVGGMWS
jgi:hypothetical protein